MSQEIFGDRLLVVDDEPAFGTIVKRVAQGCGFEVVVTETAGAFISAARLWHPTVILLDLKIPGSDGIELLRSLAADKCQAHVVLSSGADTKVLEAASLPTRRVKKISEGHPNLLDFLTDGEVALVMNTPRGKGARTDEGKIRAAAVQAGVPCLTTIEAATAAVRAMEALREEEMQVQALQDRFRT